MNTLDGLPLLDHYTNLLSTGEEPHAWAVLDEFFDYFYDNTAKDSLWFLLVTALKSDDDQISGLDRGNMIFFYEHCIALFAAARALHQKHKSKERKQAGDTAVLMKVAVEKP